MARKGIKTGETTTAPKSKPPKKGAKALAAKKIRRTEELDTNEFTLHERRRKELALPLAALLMADWDQLAAATGGSSLSDDKVRALNILLDQEGYTAWNDVTAGRCMKWLAFRSEHDQAACARIMRRLLLNQLALGIDADILQGGWEVFVPVSSSEKEFNKNRTLANNEQQCFSPGQCRDLFNSCFSFDTGDPLQRLKLSMAVLLMVTLSLSFEELCALTLGDFTYLNDYKSRMVVHVWRKHQREAGKENFRSVPFSNPYKERYLPLATLLSIVYDMLENNIKQLGKGNCESLDYKKLPLFPSRQNYQRKMTPPALRAEVESFLAGFAPIQATAGIKLSLLTPIQLAQNTAIQNLREHGCEEEEIRRIKGQAPKLVSGQNYHDFVNEASLNKIGAIQDRWISQFCPELQEKQLNKVLPKERASLWTPINPVACTHVHFEFAIRAQSPEELPQHNAVIQLAALRGLSASISYSSTN